MAPMPSKVFPVLFPFTLIVVAAVALAAGVAVAGTVRTQQATPSSVATAAGTRRPSSRGIMFTLGPLSPNVFEPLRLFSHRNGVRSRVPRYRLVHHGVAGGDSSGIRHALDAWGPTAAAACSGGSG